MAWLDEIQSPQDLKKIPEERLPEVAAQVRELILHTCSENGGHLAPSLGVVELTLALHTVFDAPRDRIVWDVGHQAYAHKILTGRRDRFPTLRKYGGISGFPRRAESPYDTFGTAHGSTAISAALGMAAARDIAGGEYNIVARGGGRALTRGARDQGPEKRGRVAQERADHSQRQQVLHLPQRRRHRGLSDAHHHHAGVPRAGERRLEAPGHAARAEQGSAHGGWQAQARPQAPHHSGCAVRGDGP